MILDTLYQAIAAKGMASQRELAKEFALSEDGVDAMLLVWVKKGKISRMQDVNASGQVIRVRYCLTQPNAISVTARL